jgi:hypothetical protein
MNKRGWLLAVAFVFLITAIAFLFNYQALKIQDIREMGPFADLPPTAYYGPALNAIPYTLAAALIAVLVAILISGIFSGRHVLARSAGAIWSFAHRHRWAVAFLSVLILSAVLFRYHAVNTPRGIYILDRWTGNIERVHK